MPSPQGMTKSNSGCLSSSQPLQSAKISARNFLDFGGVRVGASRPTDALGASESGRRPACLDSAFSVPDRIILGLAIGRLWRDGS
jgi:hypothetical protein